jgi:putative transposase
MVVQEHPMLSVRSQCRLLRLSRSSYYCQPKGESAENLAIMKKIDEVYLSHPYYGSRRMTHVLTQEGVQVSRHRVRRLMRLMGIQAIHPKPRTSINNPEHKVYPYLLRNLPIKQPNQVWCSDITYVPMKQGFMYLTAIMDWYSRKVLSWRLSNTLDTSFCVESLEEALHTYGKPKIFNTDQGAQYTSDDFINVLKKQKIKISMDGKGRWMDNVMIERLWRSVKYECLYLEEFDSIKALINTLKNWFNFYNEERPHATFDGRCPNDVYDEPTIKLAA